MQGIIPPRYGMDDSHYIVVPDVQRPGKWLLVRSAMQPVYHTLGTYDTQEAAQAALDAIKPRENPWDIHY